MVYVDVFLLKLLQGWLIAQLKVITNYIFDRTRTLCTAISKKVAPVIRDA